MSELDKPLSTEEAKYFDTRGREEPIKEEAPKEEVKTEAPKEEPKADAPQEQKQVPISALMEEREEKRRLKAELAEQRALIARGNQRLEQLIASTQPKEELPGVDTDPVGRIDKRLDHIDTNVKQFIEHTTQQQQFNNLINTVKAQEAQFAQATPDYHDALNYIRAQRVEEYQMFGFPEHEARQRVAQEELAIAQAALTQGDNPARRIYEAASRRGYASKKAAPTADKSVETIAKGQEASKSLSTTPGTSTPNIDIAALAKMDDDDFAAYVANNKKWRKVWGE